MHLHNGYGAADVTSHRQHHHQLFSTPSETFHLPTNFSMPASSSTLPDLDSQQPFIQHHHLPLFSDNQQQLQQQQQLSEMIVEPLASSKFRAGNGIGIDHRNGSLIGLTGGDHKDITVAPYRSPSPAQFWRGNSNGMLEQQLLKFQRIGTAEPNYQHQASEFEVQNGSAGEIYETRHFPNPNSNNVTASALKCSKCSRDSNAEDEYEKKLERQLKLMAQSFENQILAHQERLYERFTAKIEELERKRNEREESRRAAEAENAQAQALARAEEQAAAASRGAVLVSYLERITGGKIQLPASGAVHATVGVGGGGRWPTEEVNDLVKVRSEMESRFLEPGSKKNSLWEEISAEMGKLGHQRDAKRCKEKWENIKKYYERKKKEEELEGGSVKKKRRRYKACGYLDKLNQLYLNNLKADGGNNGDSSNTGSYSNGDVDQSKDYCEGEGDGEENQLLREANGDRPSESKSEENAG